MDANSRELFLHYVRLSCSVRVQVANKLHFISDKFDSEGAGTKRVMGKTNLLQSRFITFEAITPGLFSKKRVFFV